MGSLDVRALYASIDNRVTGVKVKERILKSQAKYEWVDYKWELKYRALNMNPTEVIDARYQKARILTILHQRLSSHGYDTPTTNPVKTDAKQ